MSEPPADPERRVFPIWLWVLSALIVVGLPLLGGLVEVEPRLSLTVAALLISLIGLARSVFLSAWHGLAVTTRVRLTLDGHACMLGAILFLMTGLNTGSNLLYIGAALLSSLLLMSRLFAELGLRGLKLRRQVSPTATCGEPAQIEVWIRNDRRVLPNFGLLCEEEDALAEGGEAPSLFFTFLPAGQTARGQLMVTFTRRGRMRLERLRIRSGFPLGLVEKVSRVTLPAQVLVRPRIWALDLERVFGPPRARGEGPQSWLGQESWDRLKALREYRPGDAPRTIHWKATARRGVALVREYERPRPRRTAVILDLEAGAAPDAFEQAVSLAASALVGLQRRGGDACLALGAELIQASTPEGLGRALDALALVEPEASASVSPLAGASLRLFITARAEAEALPAARRTGASRVLSVEAGIARFLAGEAEA